jgi:hypothetical protein
MPLRHIEIEQLMDDPTSRNDMKNKYFPAALVAAFITVPAIAGAFTRTTLKTYDTPLAATISLEDAGRTRSGKRVISYRISIESKSCRSSLTGKAEFLAGADEQRDDSAFLRNGDVVKTNIFKGIGPDSDVMLTMDVESNVPRYADVVIKNKTIDQSDCIPNGEAGLVFFQQSR